MRKLRINVTSPYPFSPPSSSSPPPIVQNSKFSDFVDKQTGYKTKNMLTFPLVAEKEVLGVVMALNKIGADSFTSEDEKVRLPHPQPLAQVGHCGV